MNAPARALLAPLRTAWRWVPVPVRHAHRHVTRANAALVAGVTVVVGVLIAGSLQLTGGPAGARSVALTPSPQSPSTSSQQVALPPLPVARQPRVLPTLPPLRALIGATVLVTSSTSIPVRLEQRILALSRANASLRVAAGQVALGTGTTRAIAADPVKMRVWTPPITGRAVGVWQRAAIGEAIVAHAVAKADDVPLGGPVSVRYGPTVVRLRVGALATTQLPGVGLVLDEPRGQGLGLIPGTGLLVAVPGADPAVVAAVLTKALGPALSIEPVLSSEVRANSWAPPAIGPITSPFGMRINPFTHLPQFHEGIDIGAPIGAPVYAMSDGQVLYAGPASGYGNEIVLSHAGGVSTVYGHVSQILISTGAVRAGQVIAFVGSEGESTGPHLHAEVHVQDSPVDPVAWLRSHGVTFSR